MSKPPMNKMTEKRMVFKPIAYDWALKAMKLQNEIHWVPEEVNLSKDRGEFYTELDDHERTLLTQILRFFTQADLEVGRAYLDYYVVIFKCPEIRMMLVTFAAMEAIHVLGYSRLLDALMLPDDEYSKFLDYKEMMDKYDYMQSFDINSPFEIAKTIAIVSGFIEGLALFSSFTILLYFSNLRGNLTKYPEKKSVLRGVGQIVTFSMRDELVHCMSMIKLFHVYLEENNLTIAELEPHIHEHCHKIVDMEVAFIKLAFADKALDGLSAEEIIAFIHYIANLRLQKLGFKPLFDVFENPLPWMDLQSIAKFPNFFENAVTEYSKQNILPDDFDNIANKFKTFVPAN